MRILIDTHTFIWFVLNQPQLSNRVRNLINDCIVHISSFPGSAWECSFGGSASTHREHHCGSNRCSFSFPPLAMEREKIGGRASKPSFPGRAWEREEMS